ncbi:MAG: hypothetical protein Q8R91_03740, partial [Candidatus Omnitrophota bacterium]|nr:hypothetical protein [Candidatus Omnitrophota bacterium]
TISLLRGALGRPYAKGELLLVENVRAKKGSGVVMPIERSVTGLYCCGRPVNIGDSHMNQHHTIMFRATCDRCKSSFEASVNPPPGSQGWWVFRGIVLGQHEFALRK